MVIKQDWHFSSHGLIEQCPCHTHAMHENTPLMISCVLPYKQPCLTCHMGKSQLGCAGLCWAVLGCLYVTDLQGIQEKGMMCGFVNRTCPAEKAVSHAARQPVKRRSSSGDCSSGSYCALGVPLVFFMSCFMDTPGFCGSEALVCLAGLQRK